VLAGHRSNLLPGPVLQLRVSYPVVLSHSSDPASQMSLSLPRGVGSAAVSSPRYCEMLDEWELTAMECRDRKGPSNPGEYRAQPVISAYDADPAGSFLARRDCVFQSGL
jgi:hypothetical protein